MTCPIFARSLRFTGSKLDRILPISEDPIQSIQLIVSWNLGKQAINPSRKVFRKTWANIIPGFFEPRRLDVIRHISRIGAPVCIRHEPQFVVMKIGLGMQQKLDMTPIPKLAIPFVQFHSTLKLRKSIGMFCSKN